MRDASVMTVVDVLGEHALKEAVCLCKWTPKEDSTASQYELFSRFCACAPLLQGSRVLLRSQWMLNHYLQIELPICAEHCNAIWSRAAEKLQSSPMQWTDFLPRKNTLLVRCKKEHLHCAKVEGAIPVLDGNSLLQTEAVSICDWQKTLEQTADEFARCGHCGVALDLPADFALKETDVYHVEEALKKNKRSREEENRLYFQLARMLCQLCRVRDWFFLLRMDGCGIYERALLEQLEQSVGLPNRFLWFTKQLTATEELLSFFSKPREHTAIAAVVMEALASERELLYYTDALWARYPKGGTAFVCDDDVRYLAYERERMKQLII